MSCRTERSSFWRTRVAETPAGKLSVRSEKARLRARNLTAIGPAGRVGSLPRGAAVGRGWAGSPGPLTPGAARAGVGGGGGGVAAASGGARGLVLAGLFHRPFSRDSHAPLTRTAAIQMNR